ncbi:hypothetical protein GGX14DRAFT_392294 [Mycena pura]|uniref:Uncharacterized protein n=1 Tax=Mycena pura TaxID=153505 RepID=A0AAD6YDE6_9AGAR|nr:hypothetical protein GGX14DRAFT_392294 [Mycena pura]
MSSPGKRKRAQPPSKVILSEGSGDEAPPPAGPSSSFWSSRQPTPLFLPASSDEDIARRRRNFEIIDYAEAPRRAAAPAPTRGLALCASFAAYSAGRELFGCGFLACRSRPASFARHATPRAAVLRHSGRVVAAL